jgi:hypothetical protein
MGGVVIAVMAGAAGGHLQLTSVQEALLALSIDELRSEAR